MRKVLGGQIITRTMDLMPSSGKSGTTTPTIHLYARDIKRLIIIIERTVRRREAGTRCLRIIISDWRRRGGSRTRKIRKIASQTRARQFLMNLRRASRPRVGGMINLKNLKMDHFLKSKRSNFLFKIIIIFYFSRRVSVKLEGNESKPENDGDKDKEKKKESNWLKPKTINKKYVFFL